MNVLVIGGAGYIGSHVVKELLDNNYNVTVFDNLSSGSDKNLFKDAQFFRGDILTLSDLQKIFSVNSFDAVFHFAAFKAAGESMVHPQKYSHNNITGTLNILNAVTAANINKFIFSSSAAVYGAPQYLPIDENHPTEPENYYGFTKLEIEKILFWYDSLCHLKYACLRYFNAAGYNENNSVKDIEKNPQNLIPVVMEVASGLRGSLKIFGNDYDTIDGTGVRDYIHVTDLAKAHVLALKFLIERNESITLNLGSEQGFSVKQIVDEVQRITGKSIAAEVVGRRSGDCAKLFATSKNAFKKLQWKAEHSSMENIVSTTWKQYKSIYSDH